MCLFTGRRQYVRRTGARADICSNNGLLSTSVFKVHPVTIEINTHATWKDKNFICYQHNYLVSIVMLQLSPCTEIDFLNIFFKSPFYVKSSTCYWLKLKIWTLNGEKYIWFNHVKNKRYIEFVELLSGAAAQCILGYIQNLFLSRRRGKKVWADFAAVLCDIMLWKQDKL